MYMYLLFPVCKPSANLKPRKVWGIMIYAALSEPLFYNLRWTKCGRANKNLLIFKTVLGGQPPSFLGITVWMTSVTKVALIHKLLGSIDVLGVFVDMLPIYVGTTRHW